MPPLRAWLLGPALLGAALLPHGPIGGLGITPAAAAPAYYTRKRINGRWVTGKFPARGSGSAGAAEAAQPSSAPQAAAPAPDQPAPGAQPVAQSRQVVRVRGARARVRFSERRGLAKARYSSLPRYRPRVVLRPATSGENGEARTAVAVPLPPPAPPPQVAARPAQPASPLPPERVVATASITAPAHVTPGTERMRSALEARARSMASDLGVLALPLPEVPPAVRLTARSVTFDLDKGERTVVFEDGAVATAPFDRARAGSLTGMGAPSR